jgi:prepilin-type N-terminal cleavage/methylation domain-containing protein
MKASQSQSRIGELTVLKKNRIPKNQSNSKESGFTLIEILITTILLAMLLFGFRYTVQAYMKQINRSWAERYMEQYGNSTVEYIARNMVNAKQVNIPPNIGNFATFYVIHEDPNLGQISTKYSSSETDGIMVNDEKLFPDFPPEELNNRANAILGPSESIELTEFRIDSVYRPISPYFNPVEFKGRLFKVTLKMIYTQKNYKPSVDDYFREMMFTSQVSLKNRKTNQMLP